MIKAMNSLLEQIKRITLKGVIGWLLLLVGVACWVFGLCVYSDMVNEMQLLCFIIAFLIIGSICIWLGIKINPKPFLKVLKEDDADKPIAGVRNYSTDFAEICTQLDHQCTMQRVDSLIAQIGKGSDINA